MDQSRVD